MSTNLKPIIYQWLNNVQFFLLPGTCVICHQSTMRQQDLCTLCQFNLPALKHPCQRCALPLPPGKHSGILCGGCITQAPPFLYSVSAFEYCAPVSRLISNFKDHGSLCCGKVLAQLLTLRLEKFYQDKPLPQIIIPMPLHCRRLQERGYNQAGELSKYLSKRMQIPVDHRLCQRIHDSPAQRGLTAKKRRQNLRHAFRLTQKNKTSQLSLPNLQRVAIVDDVVTTMSTVTELSKELMKSGVNEIHVWSLARTCKS